MRPQEFQSFLKAQPYRPIRVTLTDGRTYDVSHSDQAMVLRGSVVISVPNKGENEDFPDRFTTISLLHVMQIDTLESHKTH